MAAVHVSYYTDPACPWSWAAEPALRRVQVEFGEQVAITYVMAGMARDLADPAHELHETLEASAASGMPVDPRIWVQRPGGRAPRSTYPACQGVKAAAEQGLDGPYLRALREGFMIDREPLDSADALVAVARGTDGLDVARFEIDLRSNAIAESFAADLDRARAVPPEAQAEGKGRVKLPTFEVGGSFVGADGLRGAVVAAGGHPGPLPTVLDLLARFGRVAAAEVAAACGLPAVRAGVELWHAAGEWRARPEPVLFGEVWHAA